jgi:hypothetical protein
MHFDQIRMRQSDALQFFSNDIFRFVDKFFHSIPPAKDMTPTARAVDITGGKETTCIPIETECRRL